MSSVSGKTRNGFTYEGDYDLAGSTRVRWTATFRHEGDFAGMRHGLLHDLNGLTGEALDAVVRQDIETTWTEAV
jgi:hypothetical protein